MGAEYARSERCLQAPEGQRGDLEKLLRRGEGSGRPPKTATSANIEKVRAIIQDAPKSSLADIKQLTDIPRSSAQVILKTHLNKKPLTQVKGQRIFQKNVTKRLVACEKWAKAMEDDYKFDPRKGFWADEKMFRIGVAAGGNQN